MGMMGWGEFTGGCFVGGSVLSRILDLNLLYFPQRPEHSSCRPERWLQMFSSTGAGDDPRASDLVDPAEPYQACNFVVASPTDPANYFHLLRRQLVWSFRRPLIILAPKRTLRYQSATSPLMDILREGSVSGAPKQFSCVLDDPSWEHEDKGAVSGILLCCGELYYELLKLREQGEAFSGAALVRLEQLAPFPSRQLSHVVGSYPHVNRVAWAQEEPANNGAMNFVRDQLLMQKSVPSMADMPIQWISRPGAAAPAVGDPNKHKASQLQLINDILAWDGENGTKLDKTVR
jgi:2-oxoglutarate dehydrogenase complex dehydrogenase (E1) component-like enzyme